MLFLIFFSIFVKHSEKLVVSLVSHSVRLHAASPVNTASRLAPVLGPLGAGAVTTHLFPHINVPCHQGRRVGARGLGLRLRMLCHLTVAGHNTVARDTTLAGHTTLTEHRTLAEHTTLAGHKTLWLNTQHWLDTQLCGWTHNTG